MKREKQSLLKTTKKRNKKRSINRSSNTFILSANQSAVSKAQRTNPDHCCVSLENTRGQRDDEKLWEGNTKTTHIHTPIHTPWHTYVGHICQGFGEKLFFFRKQMIYILETDILPAAYNYLQHINFLLHSNVLVLLVRRLQVSTLVFLF